MTAVFQIIGMTFSFSLAVVLLRRQGFLFYGFTFLCCGLILFEKYLWETEQIVNFPFLVEVFVPLSFTIPVLLFIADDRSKKISYKWSLFFIGLLPYLNFLPLYSSSIAYKNCYINHEMTDGFSAQCHRFIDVYPTVISEGILDVVLILAFLLLIIFILINRTKDAPIARSSKTVKLSDDWSILVLGLALFAFVAVVSGVLLFSEFVSINSYVIPIIGFIVFIFLMDRSAIFQQLLQSKSYADLSDPEIADLYTKIKLQLDQKDCYSNSELTLVRLANEMNMSANKLSFVLSQNNTSFRSLLNLIRIQKAAEFLKSPECLHYSIQGIASMFGYKSKSTFYLQFKKQYAMTPKAFMKQYQNGTNT